MYLSVSKHSLQTLTFGLVLNISYAVHELLDVISFGRGRTLAGETVNNNEYHTLSHIFFFNF